MNNMDHVADYAMKLGFRCFFSRKGDLIVKKPGPFEGMGTLAENNIAAVDDIFGLEWFDPLEREQPQKDELNHIITILIR